MPEPADKPCELRDRLLVVAIEEFGEHGFEGVGTRHIARLCDTPMSSITYHFGGKEGLYLAAADHIAASISSFLGPALETVPLDAITRREEAVEAVLVVLDRFAQLMLAERSESWVQFILREQHHPTAAFDRLFEGAMRPVVELALALIALARPDLSRDEVRATGILLWGQAVMLRSGRASIARVYETTRIEPETGDLLRRQIAANARCILLTQPETKE